VGNREIPGDDGDVLLVSEVSDKLIGGCSDVGDDDVAVLHESGGSARNAILGIDVVVDAFFGVVHEHGSCEGDCSTANPSYLAR
jgi:hypothetical protein